MEGTINIKFGSFEVSCSGSEAFIEKSFPVALQVAKEVFLELDLPSIDNSSTSQATTVPSGNAENQLKFPLAVSTICAKLKVESGPDLIMAACFALQRQGKASCTRKQIAAEMKQATSYFKASYISNLSASLKNLITSNKLLEQAKDVFAIDAATISTMESQLGIG